MNCGQRQQQKQAFTTSSICANCKHSSLVFAWKRRATTTFVESLVSTNKKKASIHYSVKHHRRVNCLWKQAWTKIKHPPTIASNATVEWTTSEIKPPSTVIEPQCHDKNPVPAYARNGNRRDRTVAPMISGFCLFLGGAGGFAGAAWCRR